jgi:hypothetical protein
VPVSTKPGQPSEVLFDNDRGLVGAARPGDPRGRVQCQAAGFCPALAVSAACLCPVSGAQQGQGLAGRHFGSWSGFEAHLDEWTREIADQRVHGTTGEVPIERFRQAEAAALRPIAGIPPFAASRELVRKVQADCAIEVDGNAYSVPSRLIGETVRVSIAGGDVRVSHAGREVAVHQRCSGRFGRCVNPLHFAGVVGFRAQAAALATPAPDLADAELLRPLDEYERLVGGRW